MKRIKWSDRLVVENQSPWLLLIKGEKIVLFEGKSIKGFCGIVKRETAFENGKWGNTTFTIWLQEGVHHIPDKNGWDFNTFLEGLGIAVGYCAIPHTWIEVAECFSTSESTAKKFLREWKPEVAKSLDENDQPLA